MEQLFNLSHFEIEKIIPDEQVKISRIISLALVAGPLTILILLLFFFKNDLVANLPNGQDEQTTILLYFFFACVVIFTTAFIFFPKIFSDPQRLSSTISEIGSQSPNAAINALINFDRTYMLLRIAFMEGLSFMGIVILLITTLNTHIVPVFSRWYLLLPLLFQTIYTITQYISKEKMVERIESIFLPALKKATQIA